MNNTNQISHMKKFILDLLEEKEADVVWFMLKAASSKKEHNEYHTRMINKRKEVKKLNSVNELIIFCKKMDKECGGHFESEFCKKFNLNYTGVLNNVVRIEHIQGNWIYSPNINDISFDANENSIVLVFNDGANKKINLTKKCTVEFIDRKFHVNSEDAAYKMIEHWKQLKNKLKIQEIRDNQKYEVGE